jgi:arsenate reductase (glutaredoxin)
MTEVTIYHNPRCSKSREALKRLEAHGIEPEIRLYLEAPPSTQELKTLLGKLGCPVRSLMRTKETRYQELELDQVQSEQALIEAISANPILLERPVVVRGQRAVIGRPPENVEALFG